jgi:hypothetical protein
MTAAGAEAVQFEAVGLNGEAVFGSDFFLQALNFAVFELDDLAAAGANQVVVVSFVGDVVILGLGAEMAGLSQACFAKQIERAVDRGQAEMGVTLRQLVIHRFRRDMFLAKKGAEDQFALAGELELMFGQVVFQGLHLFRIFARRHDYASVGAVIKNQSLWPVKRRDLTAFFLAVYSSRFNTLKNVRLMLDAQA